ncbi:hypothetical protein HanPI659440_Chr09g0329871 [Helianthus annuus]|nr:hypothetical protein HanPI659440_Chr09g0329871 [Helianthus annuus]
MKLVKFPALRGGEFERYRFVLFCNGMSTVPVRYRKYRYRKTGKSGTGSEYTGSVPVQKRYRYLPGFYS